MDIVREYLLSVTAVSILCGIISTLVGKKGVVSSILKLLMGTVLALTVIHPLVNLQITQFHWYIDGLSTDVQAAVSHGEDMSVQAMEGIIKSETQAYILDKAASLEVDLDVDVILNDMVPAEVHLSGPVSPNARTQISDWIADNLGIPREAQHWDE